PNHFNMSMMVRLDAGVQVETLSEALAAVLRRYDALRIRYEKGSDGTWRQVCAPEAEIPLEIVDLSDVSSAELRQAIETVAANSQRTLNLNDGPLARAVYMALGGERGARLSLVIHHLAVDISSWRILFEDLQTAYKQLANGEELRLRAETTSYSRWAERLKAYASSDALQQEVGYWTDKRRLEVQPMPVDYRGENRESTTRHINNKLSRELTQTLLHELPRVYKT